MRRVFDRSFTGHQAAPQMLELCQGSRSVSDYAIDFRTLALFILAPSCGWDDQALFNTFLHSLSNPVKDKLAAQVLPSN